MINNKIVSTRLLLSIGFMMSVQLSHAVKLSIDNLTPINLSDDVNYVLAAQVIEFNSAEPVICRKINDSSTKKSTALTLCRSTLTARKEAALVPPSRALTRKESMAKGR